MKFGKHIVLAVILVALAGYYYYFDVVKKERQEQAEEAAKKVFSLDLDTVDELTLTRPEETEISLVKSEGKTWSVQSPVQDNADSMEVEEVLGRLRDLSYVKAVTDKAEDLKPFGLDRPELEARFHTPSEWQGLLVGSKSPVGSEFYAKASGQPLVFMITGADRTVLDKKLFDVRNKQLFRCETDQVDRVDFTKGDLKADLARDENGLWTAEGHEKLRISKNKLEEVIRDFCWSRVREFVQEDDQDSASYGLDSPVARFSLKKGDERRTLFFGKNKSDDNVYARLEGRPGVVVMEARLLNTIPASLTAIEDRRIVSFDKEAVTEVSWTRDGKTFVLTKQPADEKGTEGEWEFQSPESMKGQKLDSWKLDSQFYRIEELEYTQKLESDKSALPSATMDLILKNNDKNTLVSMHLGPADENATDRSVWIDATEGVEVYSAPENKVTEIASRMEEMESNTP